MVVLCVAVGAGFWVLFELLLAGGAGWQVLVGVLVTTVGLAWLGRREAQWIVGLGGLLLGAALSGSLVAVAPTLPHCLAPLGPEVAYSPCMADEGHPAMRLGAQLGGVVGLAVAPLMMWWRRRPYPALDRADPTRLALGAWLGAAGSVHLMSVEGWAGWGALLGATVLVAAPTLAAWRGTGWLRRVYAGTAGPWRVEIESKPAVDLPLLVAGQHPHASDAVLTSTPLASNPYRDTVAPRYVARVCSRLDLQLVPLRWRLRAGILLLLLISVAATIAALDASPAFRSRQESLASLTACA